MLSLILNITLSRGKKIKPHKKDLIVELFPFLQEVKIIEVFGKDVQKHIILQDNSTVTMSVGLARWLKECGLQRHSL